MKKYTPIYSEYVGHNNHQVVISEHIETDNIHQYINDAGISGSLWHVFDGHCKASED